MLLWKFIIWTQNIYLCMYLIIYEYIKRCRGMLIVDKKNIFYSFCILISNVLDQRSIKQNVKNTHSCLWRWKPQHLNMWSPDQSQHRPHYHQSADPNICFKRMDEDLLCRMMAIRLVKQQQDGRWKLKRTWLFAEFFSLFRCSNVLWFKSAFFVFLLVPCVHVSNKCQPVLCKRSNGTFL